MNKKHWFFSTAAVIVGLSLGSLICQADSVPRPAHAADPQNGYSAAALYNLGNSFARQRKPALAVLNYERARILAPLDPDVRANLRQVRESAGLPSESNRFGDYLRWLSPNETYWIGVMGLLLAGVGWLLLGLRTSYRIASRAALGTGLLMIIFTIGGVLAIKRVMHRSVVLQSAAASAAPISGAETIFTVPQAAVVQQQEEHAGFVLIRDSQGKVGWVSRNQLIPIISAQEEVHAKT